MGRHNNAPIVFNILFTSARSQTVFYRSQNWIVLQFICVKTVNYFREFNDCQLLCRNILRFCLFELTFFGCACLLVINMKYIIVKLIQIHLIVQKLIHSNHNKILKYFCVATKRPQPILFYTCLLFSHTKIMRKSAFETNREPSVWRL